LPGRRLFLHYGDLIDASSLNRILEAVEPSEVYNLGAQSHVHVSFQNPGYTSRVNGIGALQILDAIRGAGSGIRFYQASSSELYGKIESSPQNESTRFHPRSPYACSKLFAYWATVNYREAYGLYACNGILFNHESPRRGEIFVTRKISRAVARIASGKQDKLYLGNLNAKRDWGYAKEYVEAMWRMLQQDEPDDYVIATNEAHTVREFCDEAFRCIGIALRWEGEGVEEIGVDSKNGKKMVEIDPAYFRPAEVDALIGDYSKAKQKLGWEPTIRFGDLVRLMVEHDLEREK